MVTAEGIRPQMGSSIMRPFRGLNSYFIMTIAAAKTGCQIRKETISMQIFRSQQGTVIRWEENFEAVPTERCYLK